MQVRPLAYSRSSPTDSVRLVSSYDEWSIHYADWSVVISRTKGPVLAAYGADAIISTMSNGEPGKTSAEPAMWNTTRQTGLPPQGSLPGCSSGDIGASPFEVEYKCWPAAMAPAEVKSPSRHAKRPKSRIREILSNRDHSEMSGSRSQPCSFADVAVYYRVYILDDLLAEPQEICHDWLRNLLYISQRYRQGHSFAPIETSREISVFDIARADVIGTVDLRPYDAPHGMELDENCSYLYANVSDGAVWIDPESRYMTNYAPSAEIVPARRTSEDFIAEIDLRNGKMRQRVNVPESETPTDGRFVAFSAPAIRFASRTSSNGLPVINVDEDPVIEAIKAKFNVRTIYVTSRNIMLV
ncbi:hypothetical protein JX265_002026 [Neoarthrinium moseri]|uniref:Uncharacterized protein n=1 Tax=Neoarthrinium moseri TaxID=1658444 RepID=A0A9P9WW78_9PEZI|nr:hypothetical protein JX265_002026 [Neoarthrinium moseri]